MSTVHAFVYHGPGKGHWDSVQDPVIEQPTDALVRVDAATVCVGDLHMLRGRTVNCSQARFSGTKPSAKSWRSAPRCTQWFREMK